MRVKTPHLAIFTQMGNGHMYPVLPLCSELAARGYRVTCPTNERYSDHVLAARGEPVVFNDTPVSAALRAENAERANLLVTDTRRFDTTDHEWAHFTRSTNDFVAQVTPFYEENVPDLVLYNRYCIAGRIVGQRLGAPALQISPHFAYPGTTRLWDKGVSRMPEGVVAYADRLDEFLATHGLTSAGNLWHLERLNIHFIPREFQYRSELFDDGFLFTGCLLDRHYPAVWRRREGREPIVLISAYSGLPETQSSNERYFDVFIEALADTACHCVLSVGQNFPTASLGPLPANFEVNQRASHLEILPHAALLVCHGGMGSSLEALYHGVPVLTIPNTPYTEEVAYRVVDLGAGRRLSQSELCADTLRNTVEEMLTDTSLIETARGMQQAFMRAGGAGAAAERIESFLEEA